MYKYIKLKHFHQPLKMERPLNIVVPNIKIISQTIAVNLLQVQDRAGCLQPPSGPPISLHLHVCQHHFIIFLLYKFLLRLERSRTDLYKCKGKLCLFSWQEQAQEEGKQQTLILQFSANEGQHFLLPLRFEGTKKKNCTSERHLNDTGATRAAPGRQGSAKFPS